MKNSKQPPFFLLMLFLLVSNLCAEDSLMPDLQCYLNSRSEEFSQIPEERKADLQSIADYVSEQLNKGQTARLTFVCTHNSRRSHFAQLWAKAAATYYHLGDVETFSGGTETTAFNPRSVAALERAGFNITVESADTENPIYLVSISKLSSPEKCFSKVYDSPPNPRQDFCAVMTCSEADRECPNVRGADRRIAIPYIDPKIADNSPQESDTYDQRCAQIAREMLFAMSQVKKTQ